MLFRAHILKHFIQEILGESFGNKSLTEKIIVNRFSAFKPLRFSQNFKMDAKIWATLQQSGWINVPLWDSLNSAISKVHLVISSWYNRTRAQTTRVSVAMHNHRIQTIDPKLKLGAAGSSFLSSRDNEYTFLFLCPFSYLAEVAWRFGGTTLSALVYLGFLRSHACRWSTQVLT